MPYTETPGNGRSETPNERDEMVPTHIVGNMGAPNSASIRIEGRTYSALVDSGAVVSVISSRIYESFRPRLELQKKDVKLRTTKDPNYM